LTNLVIGFVISCCAIFNIFGEMPSCPVAFLAFNLFICLVTNSSDTFLKFSSLLIVLFSEIFITLGNPAAGAREVPSRIPCGYFPEAGDAPVQEVPVVASHDPVVFQERSRSREKCPVATPQEKLRMTRISRLSGYVEVPAGRKVFRDSFCPMPGCGTWTRKMKDHAFKSHLSHFFKLPVRVMGLDPVLFH
jgi:hypothetical protein